MDYQPEVNEVVEEGKNSGKGMAIASLVLGIVGCTIGLCCCTYLGVICGILAVIFAFVSKNKDGRFSVMAIAGLILCGVALIGSIAMIVYNIVNMEANMAMYEDLFNNL